MGQITTHTTRANLLAGLFLISLGVLLLLTHVGYRISSPFLASVGAVLIWAGASQLLQRGGTRTGPGAWLALVAGVFLTARGVGWINLTFEQLWTTVWPLLLIIVGFLVIGSGHSAAPQARKSDVRLFTDYRLTASEPGYITDRTIWSVFGDVCLDLTQARSNQAVTHIHTYSLFGDVEVLVPQSLGVKIGASHVFGDTEVFGKTYDGLLQSTTYVADGFEDCPRKVIVHVHSVFGDIDIDHA